MTLAPSSPVADPTLPAATEANVLWFLPTHGDGHYLGTSHKAREVSLGYLRQIAQAADQLGYFGVLIPTGRSCEDSWIVASALAGLTERLRFLVAVRPGLLSPAVAARMTATLDRISGGRALINVVTGGDPVENKGDGFFADHAERYEITAEFLDIYTRLLKGEGVNFEGKHFRVEGGKLLYPPVQQPAPALVLRRLLRAGPRRGGAAGAEISHLGRAPGAGRGEDPGHSRPRCRARPRGHVRRAPPCHRPRYGG